MKNALLNQSETRSDDYRSCSSFPSLDNVALSMPKTVSEDTMDFSSLPSEIQDLIFDYAITDCSLNELKTFRTCARFFRDRADVYLFRVIHLSASVKSFERLKNIAAHEHLSRNVKELVFHRGTFSGHRMVKWSGGSMRAKDYDDFEGWMIQTLGPTKAFMRVSECYAAFGEEVQSESMFNRRMTWQSEMREACRSFPRLDSLTTLEPLSDLDSDYLRRRCGLTYQSSTPSYFAPYEILSPCGRDFKPRALSLDWVSGEDFGSIMTSWDMRKGGPDAVREKFSELQDLRLSFSETVNTLELEGIWDTFMDACVNLRRLSLDLQQFYTSTRILRDPECFSRKMITLILKQHFSSLQHLVLEHAMMTEDDFVNFLDKHQSTLASLKVSSWPMPITTRGESTGSIIRAFYRIGKLPMQHLSSVTINGTFSNRADGEGWTSQSPSSGSTNPNMVRYRIEQYLTHKDCVFPLGVALENQLDKSDLTPSQVTELDELPFKAGIYDESFEWFRYRTGEGLARMLAFETPRRDYPAHPFGVVADNDPGWQ